MTDRTSAWLDYAASYDLWEEMPAGEPRDVAYQRLGEQFAALQDTPEEVLAAQLRVPALQARARLLALTVAVEPANPYTNGEKTLLDWQLLGIEAQEQQLVHSFAQHLAQTALLNAPPPVPAPKVRVPQFCEVHSAKPVYALGRCRNCYAKFRRENPLA